MTAPITTLATVQSQLPKLLSALSRRTMLRKFRTTLCEHAAAIEGEEASNTARQMAVNFEIASEIAKKPRDYVPPHPEREIKVSFLSPVIDMGAYKAPITDESFATGVADYVAHNMHAILEHATKFALRRAEGDVTEFTPILAVAREFAAQED